MGQCPNCSRNVTQTTDWACPYCGYPLMTGSPRRAEGSYAEMLEARRVHLPPPPEPPPPPAPETPPAPEEVVPPSPPPAAPPPAPEPPSAPEPLLQAETPPPPEKPLELEPVSELGQLPEAGPEPPIELPPPEVSGPPIELGPAAAEMAEEAVKPAAAAETEAEPEPEAKKETKPKAVRKKAAKPKAAKKKAEPVAEAAVEPEPEPAAEAAPVLEPEPEPVVKQSAGPETPLEVTIKELNDDHIANLEAAAVKYQDKKLILSGVIEGIGRDLLDNPFLKLTTGTKQEVLRVRCTGSGKEYEEKIKLLMEGQEVTVGGVYDGFLANILLRDCFIFS